MPPKVLVVPEQTFQGRPDYGPPPGAVDVGAVQVPPAPPEANPYDAVEKWTNYAAPLVVPFAPPFLGTAARAAARAGVNAVIPPARAGVAPAVADAAPMPADALAAPEGGGEGQEPGGVPMPAGGGGGGGAPAGPEEQWRVGPTVRGQYAKAFGEAESAAAEQADAERRGQQAIADVHRAAAVEMRDAQDAQRRAEAERQEANREALGAYARVTEYSSSLKVDPNRVYANMGAGQKVAHFVGQVLGGFLQGAQNRPDNPYLAEYHRTVAEDVEAQKVAIDQARARGVAVYNLFGAMQHVFGDERAAELGARAAIIDRTKMQLEEAGARVKSDRTRADLSATLAALEMKKAEYLNQALAFVRPGGGGAAPPVMGTIDVDPKTLVDLGDGTQMAVRNEKAANEINARIAFTKATTDALRRLKALDQKATWADIMNPGSDYNQERKVIIERTLPTVSQADQQGVIREHERAPLMASLGTGPQAAAWRAARKAAGYDDSKLYDESIAAFQRNTASDLQQQNGHRVATIVVPDRKGRYVTQYVLVQPGGGPTQVRRPPLPASVQRAVPPPGAR